MALQKFTAYVCASLDTWKIGEVELTAYDPTPHPSFNLALISKHEIELDVPEFDIREKGIVLLEQEIKKERADSQFRVNLLLERISQLKAITHEVAE